MNMKTTTINMKHDKHNTDNDDNDENNDGDGDPVYQQNVFFYGFALGSPILTNAARNDLMQQNLLHYLRKVANYMQGSP